MITSKVAANQTYAEISRLQKTAAERDNTKSNDSPAGATGVREAAKEIKAEISSVATNRLHQFNAEFSSILKSVRIADQAMEQIEANVEQMETEVQTFLKMYPPYPPGSEERIEMLKRYAGLRQEIEQLTLPKDPVAQEILGHLGKQGIPELPMDASDDQISDVPVALSNARHALSGERQRLSEETDQLIQSVG